MESEQQSSDSKGPEIVVCFEYNFCNHCQDVVFSDDEIAKGRCYKHWYIND